MRRIEIEKLEKILVKPALRKSQTKLFDEKLNELQDVEQFELRFDGHWCDAVVRIYVTDENGNMVIDKTNPSEWKPKILKKRVNFDFVGVN